MKINIESLKKYNQILLSLAGTFAIVIFLIIGTFLIYDLAQDTFRQDTTIGMLSDEEASKLAKDSLRGQIVSFNNINVVDSTNQLYMIPVSQANLVDYENTEDLLGLINSYSYESYHYDRVFNNLVLCDLKTGTSKIIFEERTSITDFFVQESKGRNYIVIRANNTDTNNDKYLNAKDLQELFIYDVEFEELVKIKAKEEFTVLKVYVPNKATEIIGQFGLDRNNDGVFKSAEEPLVYYKIDMLSKKLIPLIGDDKIQRLQKLLEGNE